MALPVLLHAENHGPLAKLRVGELEGGALPLRFDRILDVAPPVHGVEAEEQRVVPVGPRVPGDTRLARDRVVAEIGDLQRDQLPHRAEVLDLVDLVVGVAGAGDLIADEPVGG